MIDLQVEMTGPWLWSIEWVAGPWVLHSTIAFGNNGDQANSDREGDFGGVVLMPMYWIKQEKNQTGQSVSLSKIRPNRRNQTQQSLCWGC